MQIEGKGSNQVMITGNVKSVDDSIKIKEAISGVLARGNRSVELNLVDSLSLTSTTIGYLMKLVNQDQVKLSVTVGDSRLYTLLEDLALLQKFNVRLLQP